MSTDKPKYICPYCHLVHDTFISRCPEKKELVPEVHRMQGRTLGGKYEIADKVAEGGMGIVYEAEHKTTNRKVAVKFLYQEILLNRELSIRFQNEARIAASIAHRNVIEIIDMGKTEDRIPYIVMEYLDGDSLASLLDTGPMSQAMAIDITLEILSGVNAAHSMGVIHRDLKPENILIMEQSGGEQIVKVLDFGISHLSKTLSGKKQSITKTGVILGTPSYISPEQARGKKTVDKRTDLYSVGVILFEMITGRLPIEGKNYNELLANIATLAPVPPHSYFPEISKDLEAVILRALEKDPSLRFSSATDFSAHLSLLQDRDIDDSIPSLVAKLPPDTLERIRKGPAVTPRMFDQDFTPTVANPFSQGETESSPSSSSPVGAPSPAKGGDSVSPVSRSMKIPSGEPPPGGTSRGRGAIPDGRTFKRTGRIVILALALAAIAGGLAYYKSIRGEKELLSAAPVQEPGLTAESKQEKHEEAEQMKVVVAGIPENASVYVDNILHPERPVILNSEQDSRTFKIEASGYETWEKAVAVKSDITLPVTMVPLSTLSKIPSGPAATPDDALVKTGKKKKAGSAKTKKEDFKGAHAEDNNKGKKKIDNVYPGLLN